MITLGCVGLFFLKHKSETFENFKKFQVSIEKEASSHIGTFCSNNWGEYTSNKFKNYHIQHWIKHQTISPYNP